MGPGSKKDPTVPSLEILFSHSNSFSLHTFIYVRKYTWKNVKFYFLKTQKVKKTTYKNGLYITSLVLWGPKNSIPLHQYCPSSKFTKRWKMSTLYMPKIKQQQYARMQKIAFYINIDFLPIKIHRQSSSYKTFFSCKYYFC